VISVEGKGERDLSPGSTYITSADNQEKKKKKSGVTKRSIWREKERLFSATVAQIRRRSELSFRWRKHQRTRFLRRKEKKTRG